MWNWIRTTEEGKGMHIAGLPFHGQKELRGSGPEIE